MQATAIVRVVGNEHIAGRQSSAMSGDSCLHSVITDSEVMSDGATPHEQPTPFIQQRAGAIPRFGNDGIACGTLDGQRTLLRYCRKSGTQDLQRDAVRGASGAHATTS